MDEDEEYNYSHEQDIYEDYNVRASIGFHDHATDSAEHINNLLSVFVPSGVNWTVSKVNWVFELDGLIIDIQNTNGFNVAASSNVLPRKTLDTLRVDLRTILRKALAEPSFHGTSFGVMLLQLVEEAQSCVDLFHASRITKVVQQGWDATSVRNFEQIMENPYGVDLSSVEDTAQYILGQSISDICKDFPDNLRILHVEPVFRSDLVSGFLGRRLEMRDQLLRSTYTDLRKSVTTQQITLGQVADTREGIAEHLVIPKVTFHGAPRHVVSSIVRYGFLIPGQKIGKTNEELAVTCGSSHGVGIYSSPSPEYASFYGRWTSGSGGNLNFFDPSQVPGFRIIVCATLMGRALETDPYQARGRTNVLKTTAHSHVSRDRMEYVVFNKTQIIPCYVLHVDYGSEDAKDYIRRQMSNPSNIGKSNRKSRIELDSFADDMTCPGARKAEKQALKAAAAKWFPYGYGPARGTNFTIEEIGHVSDDEEEFGDFQLDRHEQEREIQNWVESRGGKSSWFDEYQYVRNTKKEVRMDGNP